MFIPPINLGQFQPSPSTIAEWVYQIWQYLQDNPIATQEQLQEYISNFITSSPSVQDMIGEGVENYLVDNPPAAPVRSVQGKTGAVSLSYPDIVPSSNAVPVYKAATIPTQSTLQGQYNIGYRIFVNTATQEIYTMNANGTLTLVGKGKFDGTTVDLNTNEGDTTIAEKIEAIDESLETIEGKITDLTEFELNSTLTDQTVKLGYVQTNSSDSTKSQVMFNMYLPKPINDDVNSIRINSVSGLIIRCAGIRTDITSTYSFVDATISNELGVVRVRLDFPVNSDMRWHAATVAGDINFTLIKKQS